MAEPIIRNGKSRAELIGADFGNLPRGAWIYNGKEFQLTRMAFDNKQLVLDTRVKDLSGNVIFDDRVRMANPPLLYVNLDGSTEENYLKVIQSTLDLLADQFRGRKERIGRDTFRGDTLSVRSGTADGYVTGSDATFATMAAGSGLSANTTSADVFASWSFDAGAYSGGFTFLPFDTSTLTAGATISAAVYTLYGQGNVELDVDNYNADIRYNSFGGTVTTADWFDPRSPTWNALVAGGIFDVGLWVQTSGTANNFSDSGVYSSINKTGSTEVVVGMSGMNGSTPTGLNQVEFRSANQAGTSADPLLTVTYTLSFGRQPRNAMYPLLGR